MKISLPLVRDSHNSYPHADISFEMGETQMHIAIDDDDREIAIDLEPFLAMFHSFMALRKQ
jgi:hypothetical protein